MRIEQLKFLIAVVKNGSINAASKKAFVSQQSLNKALTALETELGFTLLERTRMGTRLTEKGEIVFNEAQAIVNLYDRMIYRLNDDSMIQNVVSGKLNIHIAPMLDVSILPLAYKEFMQSYPKVQVFFEGQCQEDIIRDLIANPGDLGFLLTENSEELSKKVEENIEIYPLKKYPILMAMSPKHPLAQHRTLSLQTIAQYPIIAYDAGGERMVHPFEGVADIKIVLVSNNNRMCEQLLNEDEALMYSFEPFVERNVFKDFIHIPVSHKNAYYDLCMAIHKESSNHQRIIANSFSQIFQEYLSS